MPASDLDALPPLVPRVGKAWLIGDRTRADEIVRRLQAAGSAFEAGDFLVGGLELGGGDENVRGATTTLRSAGVGAVIARSFAPRFHDAAIERGVPALIIEEAAAIQLGDRLRVDIEEHKIANQSSGDRYIIRNLYDAHLDVLRAGGLAAYRVHLVRRHGGTHQ